MTQVIQPVPELPLRQFEVFAVFQVRVRDRASVDPRDAQEFRNRGARHVNGLKRTVCCLVLGPAVSRGAQCAQLGGQQVLEFRHAEWLGHHESPVWLFVFIPLQELDVERDHHILEVVRVDGGVKLLLAVGRDVGVHKRKNAGGRACTNIFGALNERVTRTVVIVRHIVHDLEHRDTVCEDPVQVARHTQGCGNRLDDIGIEVKERVLDKFLVAASAPCEQSDWQAIVLLEVVRPQNVAVVFHLDARTRKRQLSKSLGAHDDDRIVFDFCNAFSAGDIEEFVVLERKRVQVHTAKRVD